MKLLIVDDEELTRTGVISSIDWASLGISEVLQADDGVHGLETAQLHRPEIILCDVRMPRMDGITMLEKLLQSFSNNCKFLQNPVKDLYYKLFLCLEDARHQQKIPGSGNPETVAETIDRCFTFGELHQTLVDKTEDFLRKFLTVLRKTLLFF